MELAKSSSLWIIGVFESDVPVPTRGHFERQPATHCHWRFSGMGEHQAGEYQPLDEASDVR
jgi:hypothetical protein